MSKHSNIYHKAKQLGLNNIQMAQLQQYAKKQTEEMLDKATEKGFIIAMMVNLNVLCSDGFWGENKAKELAPQFVDEVLSLWECMDRQLLNIDECRKYIKDVSGIDIKCNYLYDSQKTMDDMMEIKQ